MLGCSKEVEDQGPPASPDPYTQVIFEFIHDVDGSSLVTDTAQYLNGSDKFIWRYKLAVSDWQDSAYFMEFF